MPMNWKSNAEDLRSRASRVTDPLVAIQIAAKRASGEQDARISARAAAKVLAGIVSLVSRNHGIDVMQRACAILARHDATWISGFANLPIENGAVPEPVQLIAVVARGILPLAGADNVRAALSFWATEDDPGVWSSVVEG